MNRARFASLTLAGGLLLTTSGCFNLFERFQVWRAGWGQRGAAECPCHEFTAEPGTTVPANIDVPVVGPALISPGAPPPPTSTPVGPPPRIVPIPATPMPWSGQH